MGAILKKMWLACGWLCVGIATIGIFLPLIPTTPLLLLAGFCFAKGSKKIYAWLINHKLFGKYIKDFNEGRGVPLRAKISAYVMMWAAMLYSALFVLDILVLQMVVIATAVGVTIYLYRLPTTDRSSKRRILENEKVNLCYRDRF